MIRVRQACPEDIPELAKIGLAAWRKGVLPLVSTEVARRVMKLNPFVSLLSDQGAEVLVGEIDGTLAGLGASENLDNCISDLWVSPQYEGKGIGTALIRKLEERMRSEGLLDIMIGVAAGNTRALGLYQHLGFIEERHDVRREERHDPILDTIIEKVELRKSLAP